MHYRRPLIITKSSIKRALTTNDQDSFSVIKHSWIHRFLESVSEIVLPLLSEKINNGGFSYGNACCSCTNYRNVFYLIPYSSCQVVTKSKHCLLPLLANLAQPHLWRFWI